MKRLPILGAALLAWAACFPSAAAAQTIDCAAELPAPLKGRWYYRIIDGRKCWYEGKPMVPKSSLRWPEKPVVEAEAPPAPEQTATPTTDGRNVSAPPAIEPAAWPTPALDDISFESRWRGLTTER